MTVESHYAIMIAILSDWLKISRHFFNQSKPEPIASCTCDFPHEKSVAKNRKILAYTTQTKTL